MNEQEVRSALAGEGWVLLYFSAGWCRPCQVFSPIVEQAGRNFEGVFELLKVDVDAFPQLAGEHGVRSIPSLQLFHNGALVDTAQGSQPPQQLTQWLRQQLFFRSEA